MAAQNFSKFIQQRTIAVRQAVNSTWPQFPQYKRLSFIEFENPGFLIGAKLMTAHNADPGGNNVFHDMPVGYILAKSNEDFLSIPFGGNVTDFAGSRILIPHLDYPGSNDAKDLHSDSRLTTVAYETGDKRIPFMANDRLGVYACANADAGQIFLSFILTAYFVRE